MTSEKVKRAVQWAKDNPEKYKENQKRYRDKRKLNMTDGERDELLKKQRIQSKKWRTEHPEEIRKMKREYMKKRIDKDPVFREKMLNLKRKWDEKNKEHNRLYKNNRYKTNVDVREKQSIRSHDKNINNRLEVIYWYSNGEMKCNICGESHYEFLAVDHINGGGSAHRNSGELSKYSNDISKYLIGNDFPEEYQILCHNCNQIKHIESRPIKDNVWGRHRRKYRLAMLNKYSNNNIKCEYCGMRDERCLTFHHTNGGGMQEKRDIGYDSLVSYLYNNDVPLTDIVIACQNCNKSLGHHGYLPF